MAGPGLSESIRKARFPLNLDVADKLRQMADLLEVQNSSPYRINAYRKAAATLENLEEDVGTLVEEGGVEGLQLLEGIGKGISAAIYELVSTGRFSQFERLRGMLDPVSLLCTVPGIGRGLALAIHNDLHIDTLEELEIAAHDGRLERVQGIGARRLSAISASLEAILRRPRFRRRGLHVPGIRLLLEVDREYRKRAAAKDLPMIAPKRFNPDKAAWLPVMHLARGNWHFTAMFSNTARAHELGRTHDWVVIYYYDDDHDEGQCTVVTERQGRLRDLRVIRGREKECDAWYRLRDHREVISHKSNLVAGF